MDGNVDGYNSSFAKSELILKEGIKMKDENAKKIQLYLSWYFSVVIANSQELNEKSEQWVIRRELYQAIERDLENFEQFEKNYEKEFIFDPNNMEFVRMNLIHELKQVCKGISLDMLKSVLCEEYFDYKAYTEFYVEVIKQLTSHK